MSPAKGTPKTLNEAIANGLEIAQMAGLDAPDTTQMVESHVRDYMAQKFSIVILAQPDNGRADDLMELFAMVTNRPRSNRLDTSFLSGVSSTSPGKKE